MRIHLIIIACCCLFTACNKAGNNEKKTEKECDFNDTLNANSLPFSAYINQSIWVADSVKVIGGTLLNGNPAEVIHATGKLGNKNIIMQVWLELYSGVKIYTLKKSHCSGRYVEDSLQVFQSDIACEAPGLVNILSDTAGMITGIFHFTAKDAGNHEVKIAGGYFRAKK